MTARNPLLDLFADKPRSDEEIAEEIDAGGVNGEAVAGDVDEDYDEGDEKSAKTPKKSGDEEDDEDEEIVGDTVPKAVLLKERAKYRERLAEARGSAKALKEVASKPATTAETVEEEFEEPDPAKDPAGYREYVAAQTQNLILNERMNFSEARAKDKHGEEVVDTAFNWLSEQAKTNPGLARHVRAHPDPYAETVRLYNADQRSARLKDVDEKELDNFRKWSKAKKEGKLAEWEADQAKAAKKAAGKDPKSDQPRSEGGRKPVKTPKKPVVEDGDEGEDGETNDDTPPQSLVGEQTARGRDPEKAGAGPGKAFDSVFR